MQPNSFFTYSISPLRLKISSRTIQSYPQISRCDVRQITVVQTTRRRNCEKSRKEDELKQGSGKYQLGMAQERPEKGLDSTRS